MGDADRKIVQEQQDKPSCTIRRFFFHKRLQTGLEGTELTHGNQPAKDPLLAAERDLVVDEVQEHLYPIVDRPHSSFPYAIKLTRHTLPKGRILF